MSAKLPVTAGGGTTASGRVRLGLAVAGSSGAAWVAALARSLAACDEIDLTVFTFTPGHPGARTTRATGVAAALWTLFRAADAALQRLVYPASPSPAATEGLDGAGFAVADEVPSALDVVLCAGGEEPAPHLVAVAGVPVWWLDHDGAAEWPHVLSGYRETIRGEQVTCCRLIQLRPGETKPEVLASASFGTHPLFAAENRVQLLWKSIALVRRAAREAARTGRVALQEAAAPAPGRVIPAGALPLAGALGAHAWRVSRFAGRRLFWREQWCLAVIDPSRSAVPRVLIPPPDRYWADPHLVPRGDGRLVLVEEYLYATRRGRIALLTLDDSGAVKDTRTILELDGHLSYPSLFEAAGSLYMIPESSDLENLVAYRCVEYPHRWEPEGTLLAGVRAVDSTIIRHDGRWWLFATIKDEAWLTPRDTLSVFFSDDPLTGPWTPHPANPVVCDVLRARPAGPLFARGGRLYRPAQDCGRRYGYGIRISEVVTLTPDDYAEREAAFMPPPGEGFVATHTYGCDESSVIVDVLRWLPGRRG